MTASFVVRGFVALSLTAGGIAQAQSTCDAGITEAAAKKVACKLNVIARAQKRGNTVDTAELARCETKFAWSCAKARGKGVCTLQTEECDAIEAEADACVDSLSGASVQAQSSCDAGITKAAGKTVACQLDVIARAQKRGATVNTAELARCTTKFASSCTRAQATGGCTAQTQPCDAIEVTAGAWIDDLERGPTTGGPACAPTCGQKEGDPCCPQPGSGLLYCCIGPCVSPGVCGPCGQVGEACCPGNVCKGVNNCCGGYCQSDPCNPYPF
jgi:hypothetical protein